MDTCSKTAFACCELLYEQYDGVSMGASLAPVLANIIMAELERKIVDELIRSDVMKWQICRRHNENIEYVLNKFIAFDKNIQLTVIKLKNERPYFLDLEIHPDGLTIYRKDTHTGQFVNFSSFAK